MIEVNARLGLQHHHRDQSANLPLVRNSTNTREADHEEECMKMTPPKRIYNLRHLRAEIRTHDPSLEAVLVMVGAQEVVTPCREVIPGRDPDQRTQALDPGLDPDPALTPDRHPDLTLDLDPGQDLDHPQDHPDDALEVLAGEDHSVVVEHHRVVVGAESSGLDLGRRGAGGATI